MTTEQTGFGCNETAAFQSGHVRSSAMIRAVMVFSLVSFGALAQTPADLARLVGPHSVASGVSAPVARGAVGGGSAFDLARLAPAGSSVSTAPALAASGGAFAAADLARLNAAGDAWLRGVPDLALAAKQ
jgi:hypothetical protein